MKKIMVWAGIPALVLFLMLCRVTDSFALIFLPPSYESEEDFLEWYEQSKEEGGEYTLQADLKLQTGTKDNPIILDGTGEIKINCSRYSIVIFCPVVLDNPLLEISGTGDAVFQLVSAESELILYQGTAAGYDIAGLSSGDAPMVVLGCIYGRIVTGEDTNFTVRASASNAVGIGCHMGERGSFTGLNVEVDGEETWGIKAPGGVELKSSCVEINGSRKAYGLWSEGDILVENSSVHLNGSPSDACYPLFTTKGKIVVVDSDIPQWSGENRYRYLVDDIRQSMPTPARVNQAEKVLLPEGIDTYFWDVEGGCDIWKEIPVKWNRAGLDMGAMGVRQISGKLDSKALEKASASNAKGIVPRHTVIVLGEKGNFITEARVRVEEDGANIWAWAPYPYGADALYMCYSVDGVNWNRGTAWGQENLLESTPPPVDYGRQEAFSAGIPPLTQGKVMLRLEVTGDTPYSGAGEIFEIDLGDDGNQENPSLPGDAGGDKDHGSGGDRGGGSYHPGRGEETAGPGYGPGYEFGRFVWPDTDTAVKPNPSAEEQIQGEEERPTLHIRSKQLTKGKAAFDQDSDSGPAAQDVESLAREDKEAGLSAPESDTPPGDLRETGAQEQQVTSPKNGTKKARLPFACAAAVLLGGVMLLSAWIVRYVTRKR